MRPVREGLGYVETSLPNASRLLVSFNADLHEPEPPPSASSSMDSQEQDQQLLISGNQTFHHPYLSQIIIVIRDIVALHLSMDILIVILLKINR
jgi:hypothetical protein